MGMGWNVACWNLAVVGAVLAGGCTDSAGEESGGGSGTAGAETEVGDSDEPGGPSEPECRTAADCGGSFYSCENGQCIDNWDDCNYYDNLEGCGSDGPGYGTDDLVPECSADTDCARDEWCDTYAPEPACAPLAIPIPCTGEVSLAFSPVLETAEAYSTVEVVGPPGAEVIIVASPDAENGSTVSVVSLETGAVTPLPLAETPTAVTGGDVDGDGDVDVVTSRDGTVTLFEQIESGAFEVAAEVEWGGHFSWLSIASTGAADAAIIGVRQQQVWSMDALGAFDYGDPQAITPVADAEPVLVALGEFGGGGRDDVAWIDTGPSGTQAHLFVLDGNERAPFFARGGASMHVGDGQGDGIDDLLVMTSSLRDLGRTRVDVVLPEPISGGLGRALVDHGPWALVEGTAADVDQDSGSDALLLVVDEAGRAAQLVYGRELLSETACTSTQLLEQPYDALRSLQHPDGSGWVVLHGPSGFVAAPL